MACFRQMQVAAGVVREYMLMNLSEFLCYSHFICRPFHPLTVVVVDGRVVVGDGRQELKQKGVLEWIV